MGFFDTLQQQTESSRQYLLTTPYIQQALDKQWSKQEYVAYLTEAYHHVKHTVPLLMAVGSRLGDDQEWLRSAVAEYIEEEIGHQEWILNDIEACGSSKEQARCSQPSLATELMVAYAYDTVQRKNPLGFFGMVHVLEGSSVRLADRAADSLQQSLGLPDTAFSYLRSHGALDLDHVKFFEDLMNKIDNNNDQQDIIHCADAIYVLFSNIFRALSASQQSAVA